MRVLVTGAGGFLGLHLCRELINQGHQVRSLSRSYYPELEQMGVEIVQGDIQNKEDCQTAVASIQVIFHTASKVAMWGKWEDFYQTNVVGTQNIVEAALESGVEGFIYTSTPSVVFGDQDLINAKQQTPYPQKYKSRYAKSKAMAEKFVLSLDQKKMKTTALRPHLIFGPGDKNIIPRLVAKARSQKLKMVGDGKNLVDVIHVKNAVHAHLMALEKIQLTPSPIAGRAYFLGQEKPVVLWDFINQILQHYQIKKVEKKISFKAAYTIGALMEFILSSFRIFHLDPPMTRFVAMQLAKSHYFDHQHAFEQLGYQPKITLDRVLDDLDTELKT